MSIVYYSLEGDGKRTDQTRTNTMKKRERKKHTTTGDKARHNGRGSEGEERCITGSYRLLASGRSLSLIHLHRSIDHTNEDVCCQESNRS